MDVTNLLGSIIGGALGGSALTTFFINTARDRWMEQVKAHNAEALEKVKDDFASAQRSLQARLDQGNYVSRGQYDLELSSYRDLWTALSDLQTRWRSYFALFDFQIPGQEQAFQAQLAQAGIDLGKAHDSAVFVTDRLAPFYEKAIQTLARETTFASQTLLYDLSHATPTHQPSLQDIRTKFNAFNDRVEKIDTLIRERLTSLRIA